MAIQQGDDISYYPKGLTTLRSPDQLLVVGEPEELVAFQDLMLGRCQISPGSSHWVSLAAESPLVGMQLAAIQTEYNVVVRAVRRHGKLYNPVDNAMKFQPQDLLLLTGEDDLIEEVATLATLNG